MRGIWLCAVCALLLVSACNRTAVRPGSPADDTPQQEISDLTAQALAWADSVSDTLTLRQQVSQLFLPAVYASDDIWTLRLVRQYADSCVGGLLLLKGDSRMARLLADSIRTWSSVPPIVSIDAEWGLAMRLADAPEFPANSALEPSTDDQLMYDYGSEVARECRLLGINMVFGPVVDVSVPNSFMRRRSLGEDPRRVADLAIAYARGLEDGNVLSVAKHFPGHGSVTTDSHKLKGVIDRSLHEMDSIDLYPFRRWVEHRLSGVMVGHLAVPSIDSQMRPAAFSPVVIHDLLRGELGFSGLVITDALNMRGAEGYGADDAIIAGADLMVAPDKTFRQIDRVVDAVANGKLQASDIRERVRRVLFYKFLLSRPDDEGLGLAHGESIDSLYDSRTRTLMRKLSPDSL